MIDLYTFPTPNGRKPAILLEELGLPYTIYSVDIRKNEQFEPDFVAMNPNSKIPVLRDRETDLTVFESGAILIYLAEKAGRLLPTTLAERMSVLSWLMFQMGSVGPMFGQLSHFRNYAPEKVPYAITRYEKEVHRLFGVLEYQLARSPFIAGDYSIADIAIYPWVAAALTAHMDFDIAPFPEVKRWVETLRARPAVQTGMAILSPEFQSAHGAIATAS
ncbi:MAG: glutathione S-transferase N-terminal domain-containing protein [Leptolyngbyaceae cyanobacterium T60_A2020_046]|nr:glutathione S-transferase N-terminal domain-containing protein [Leptolyngbyaceae cyanobacterium T60_A2020_046]